MSKWTEDQVQVLNDTANAESPVTLETVAQLAEQLDRSTASVASKMRHLGHEVERKGDRAPLFSDEQVQELSNFLEQNSGQFTYAEIAEQLFNGAFSPRQIQGRVLHMEMMDHVAKAPPKEVARKYTEEEEAKLLSLLQEGAWAEDIAEAMGRTVKSIRGKALSMRNEHGVEIPKSRDRAPERQDVFEQLGSDIHGMTVEEIAEATGKTPRGVKSALTHRGIKVSDYDGEARRAKRDQKAAEAA